MEPISQQTQFKEQLAARRRELARRRREAERQRAVLNHSLSHHQKQQQGAQRPVPVPAEPSPLSSPFFDSLGADKGSSGRPADHVKARSTPPAYMSPTRSSLAHGGHLSPAGKASTASGGSPQKQRRPSSSSPTKSARDATNRGCPQPGDTTAGAAAANATDAMYLRLMNCGSFRPVASTLKGDPCGKELSDYLMVL
jgi:hypothetical protein